MNDTPTPRTDEAVWGETNVVEASFARQLERELAAVTKQRDRLAEAIRIHRDKAFPLTGEQFDQDLWDTLTIVKGGSDE